MATARGWLLAAIVGSILAASTRPGVVGAEIGPARPAPGEVAADPARHPSDGAAASAASAAPAGGTAARRFAEAALTPQGFDHYLYEPRADQLVVRAASTNTGGNLRQVWWASGARPVADAESCVTWTSYDGELAQAGIALRIRSQGERTTAVTVTNNVWAGARAGWNVHAWQGDLASSRLIGQALLTDAFGSSVFQQPPLPWRICARTVGATLEFRAWSLVERPVAAWGDPRYGASILLPDDLRAPGRAGWYVGHLRRGDRTAFARMDARPVVVGGLEHVAIDERAVAGCVVHTAVIASSPGPWAMASGCGRAAPAAAIEP